MKPILNFENYAITLDGRVINNTTFILSMYVNDNIDYYLEMDDDEKAFIDALNYVLDYIHKNQ